MGTSKSQSEVQILENFNLALANATSNIDIANNMAIFGYDAAKISEGKAVLAATQQAYNFNKQEDQESVAARVAFNKIFDQVWDTFKLNYKKAQVVFRNDEVVKSNLMLFGSMPRQYAKQMEKMSLFYERIQADPAIQSKLATLATSAEDITAAVAALAEAKAARNTYQNEIGESQNATKVKNAAFEAIENWMDDFYAVAKIAMEDQPQLLESLGVFVRS